MQYSNPRVKALDSNVCQWHLACHDACGQELSHNCETFWKQIEQVHLDDSVPDKIPCRRLATTFPVNLATNLRFGIGLKLLSISWSSEAFFSSIFKWLALSYAAHRHADTNDRFTIWHRSGKSRSKFSLSKDAGIGSMVHDLEPTTGAILDSSSMVTAVQVSKWLTLCTVSNRQ